MTLSDLRKPYEVADALTVFTNASTRGYEGQIYSYFKLKNFVITHGEKWNAHEYVSIILIPKVWRKTSSKLEAYCVFVWVNQLVNLIDTSYQQENKINSRF